MGNFRKVSADSAALDTLAGMLGRATGTAIEACFQSVGQMAKNATPQLEVIMGA